MAQSQQKIFQSGILQGVPSGRRIRIDPQLVDLNGDPLNVVCAQAYGGLIVVSQQGLTFDIQNLTPLTQSGSWTAWGMGYWNSNTPTQTSVGPLGQDPSPDPAVILLGQDEVPPPVESLFLQGSQGGTSYQLIPFGDSANTVAQGDDDRFLSSEDTVTGVELNSPGPGNPVLVKGGVFLSSPLTGTGSSQSIPHGLPGAPETVVPIPQSGILSLGVNTFPDLSIDSVDATDIGVTCDLGGVYRVLAIYAGGA